MTLTSNPPRLYIVNSNNTVIYEDSSLVVMDISDPVNPVFMSSVAIPNFSGQVVLDEARGFLYLPNRKSDNNGDKIDQVLRINIQEDSANYLAVESFESGEDPFGASFEGEHLFVAAAGEVLRYNVNDLSRYSAVDLQFTSAQNSKFGEDEVEEVRELSLSPSGAYLFVTNRIENMLILNVADINEPTQPGRNDLGNSAIDYVITGTSSTRGITRDSQYLYVVEGNPSSLKIMTDLGLVPNAGAANEISSASLQVAEIPLGGNPAEVLVDEAQQRAYVSNQRSDNISVIDLQLKQEIDRISIRTIFDEANNNEEDFDNYDETNFDRVLDNEDGDQPFAMMLFSFNDKTYLYVAHFRSNKISIIDTETRKVIKILPSS